MEIIDEAYYGNGEFDFVKDNDIFISIKIKKIYNNV